MLPSEEKERLKEVWLQEIGKADNMERVPPVTLMKQLTRQINKAVCPGFLNVMSLFMFVQFRHKG
jgi:hypothetical protein